MDNVKYIEDATEIHTIYIFEFFNSLFKNKYPLRHF